MANLAFVPNFFFFDKKKTRFTKKNFLVTNHVPYSLKEGRKVTRPSMISVGLFKSKIFISSMRYFFACVIYFFLFVFALNNICAKSFFTIQRRMEKRIFFLLFFFFFLILRFF